MGDMAEAILNGDFDEETGEYIGQGDGFPRSPSREARERHWGKREIDNAKRGLHKHLENKYEEYKRADLEKIMSLFLQTIYPDEYTTKGFRQKVVAVSKNFNRFCSYLNTI